MHPTSLPVPRSSSDAYLDAKLNASRAANRGVDVAADLHGKGGAGGQDDDDDFERLIRCWRVQDCGGCVREGAGCAWCPFSNTCVPLPSHGLRLPAILLPYTDHYTVDPICPLPSERYELRASGLGCSCSPTTLTTAIVACLVTAVAVVALPFVLGALWAVLKALLGRERGYELKVLEGRREEGGDWVRGGRRWFRGGEDEEVVVDGEAASREWWRSWRGLLGVSGPEERRGEVDERSRLLPS